MFDGIPFDVNKCFSRMLVEPDGALADVNLNFVLRRVSNRRK